MIRTRTELAKALRQERAFYQALLAEMPTERQEILRERDLTCRYVLACGKWDLYKLEVGT